MTKTLVGVADPEREQLLRRLAWLMVKLLSKKGIGSGH